MLLHGRRREGGVVDGDRAIPRQMQLLARLMSSDELSQWRFHGVPLFLTSAARVTEVLSEAALRGETIYEEMPIKGR